MRSNPVPTEAFSAWQLDDIKVLEGAPVGKPYIRTRDAFQTDNDRDTEGYSDEALALVADVAKTGVPEETNAIGMAGSATSASASSE